MPEESHKQQPQFDLETQTGLSYASGHVVAQTGREIVITFSIFRYEPNKPPKVVSQLILSPLHAQELALNIQKKIKELKDQGKEPPQSNPRLPPTEPPIP
jgi:hypothetical protein